MIKSTRYLLTIDDISIIYVLCFHSLASIEFHDKFNELILSEIAANLIFDFDRNM